MLIWSIIRSKLFKLCCHNVYRDSKAILPEGQAINEQLHMQEGILVVAPINQVKSQPKVLYRCTNDFRM